MALWSEPSRLRLRRVLVLVLGLCRDINILHFRSRAVPDRRGPGAFADRLREKRILAARGAFARIQLKAQETRPPTARHLEHARVVDRALVAIELGIGPYAAERIASGTARLTGVEVDRQKVHAAVGRDRDKAPA